jgi:hypothetical protein|tara:strand:- start:278 stop:1138 length:861 start_codon:yes stop_codon:yes gene_type:complete
MNRTLKRPMFRIGGSAGTGITSGLDQPQKMANGGRTGYQQGSMPSFQASGLPGFLTSFGLNLLATPPQGNIFQTAGTAAREPFNQLQTSQARSNELRGERDFLRGETDRKLTAADERLDKEITSREKIAGMSKGDENVMAYAEIFKDNNGSPNLIKGKNAVDFFDTKYNELTTEFGTESVSVEPIDITLYQSQKNIKKFRNANPGAEGKVYFDVASGKGVKLVQDLESGELKFIAADSSDIDTSGEFIPEKTNPGLFGQKVDEEKVKQFKEEMKTDAFDIGSIYDQ